MILNCSKPSLVRLQLIRIKIWKIKNSVHTWVHTRKDAWDLRARGIRAIGLWDCFEGSWRDWNHARKYRRLTWAGWRTMNFSFWQRKEVLRWCFLLLLLFSSALPISSNFPFICFVSFLYFRNIFRFINPYYCLIQMTSPPSCLGLARVVANARNRSDIL
jgi:hypothetical protein